MTARYFHKGQPDEERIDQALIEAAAVGLFSEQEYSQLPALPGWSWYDAYAKYRPDDAERLRIEWERTQ